MIAVSDTTALRHLIAIEQERLFTELFQTVFVPTAVFNELSDPRTPETVRHTIATRPRWLEVRSVPETSISSFTVNLHKGEAEAILLAETIGADILLIDEQAGRSVASERGVPFAGTLGLLERADAQGLLQDFPRILRQLKESGFYITTVLEDQLLQRHLARFRDK